MLIRDQQVYITRMRRKLRRISNMASYCCVIVVVLACSQAFSQGLEDVPSRRRTSLVYRPSVTSYGIRKKVKGFVDFELGHKSFEEDRDDVVYTFLNLGVDLKYKMASELRFNLAGGANFNTGRSQSRFETNVIDNELYLGKANLEYRPFYALRLKAGVNSQNFLSSNLLINTGMGLPGLVEELRFGKKSLGLRLVAQQSILTSQSLNTDRAEKEELPTLSTQTLEGYWKPVRGVRFLGYVTHYKFKDLPSTVAFIGRANGNTTFGEQNEDAQFLYEFDGFLTGGSVSYSAGGWNLRAGIENLENTKAPSSYNEGRKMFLESVIRLGDIKLQPKYEMFFNESDTAPAYYQRWDYGQNNRKGQALQVAAYFEKIKFAIRARYVVSDPINDNAIQARRNVFKVGVETYRVTF